MKFLIIGNGKWSKVLQSKLTPLGIEFDVTTYDYLTKLAENKYDAAIVATPAKSHFTIVSNLLQHRVPTLCEKPVAMNSAGALALSVAAIYSKTLLVANLPYLFHSAMERVAALGLDFVSYDSIRVNPEGDHRDGSPLINHGPHDIYLIMKFFPGIKFSSISQKDDDFVIGNSLGADLKVKLGWNYPKKIRKLTLTSKCGSTVEVLQDEIVLLNGEQLKYSKSDALTNALKYFVECLKSEDRSPRFLEEYAVIAHILEMSSKNLAPAYS